jgi:ketosteroid isomerase-like protein
VHGPLVLMSEPPNLEIARLAMERWNAGNLDGVLDFYAQDASMYPSPDWPEQTPWHGRERVRENMEEWRSVWESSEMEIDSLDSFGDRVLASGAWITRGRVSGVDGRWPFNIILTFRDGKIASHEWFSDRDLAVEAARNA